MLLIDTVEHCQTRTKRRGAVKADHKPFRPTRGSKLFDGRRTLSLREPHRTAIRPVDALETNETNSFETFEIEGMGRKGETSCRNGKKEKEKRPGQTVKIRSIPTMASIECTGRAKTKGNKR